MQALAWYQEEDSEGCSSEELSEATGSHFKRFQWVLLILVGYLGSRAGLFEACNSWPQQRLQNFHVYRLQVSTRMYTSLRCNTILHWFFIWSIWSTCSISYVCPVCHIYSFCSICSIHSIRFIWPISSISSTCNICSNCSIFLFYLFHLFYLFYWFF